MGIIKKFITKKKKEHEERAKLKAELLEELKPEIREMEKKKLREELLKKAEKKAGGKGLLQILGDEFKGSGMGTNEKMDRILGKNSVRGELNNAPLRDSRRFSEMMGSNNNSIKNKSSLLGMSSATKKDSRSFLGMSDVTKKDAGALMGVRRKEVVNKKSSKTDISSDDKIRRMLGR